MCQVSATFKHPRTQLVGRSASLLLGWAAGSREASSFRVGGARHSQSWASLVCGGECTIPASPVPPSNRHVWVDESWSSHHKHQFAEP